MSTKKLKKRRRPHTTIIQFIEPTLMQRIVGAAISAIATIVKTVIFIACLWTLLYIVQELSETKKPNENKLSIQLFQ